MSLHQSVRKPAGRIQGIDTLRVLAIIFVIAIHTVPFSVEPSRVGDKFDVATLINMIARFAVPFFFIVSGYFWGQKIKDGEDLYGPTINMAKRITLVFFAWSLIYILPTNIVDSFTYGPLGPLKQLYWNIVNALGRPLDTFLQGTKVHLWFLMALLWSLGASVLLLRLNEQLLFPVALVLYVIGIAGKAYSDTPLGFHIDFNFRNGPFFSLIFFATGYLLQKNNPKKNWLWTGLLIAATGIGLHIFELLVLNARWGTSMAQDYVIGTYFLGLGMGLVALSNPRCLQFPWLASAGPLVLGIYASHFIFIDLLQPIDARFAGGWMWSGLYVAAVFALSYLLVKLMMRFDLTRKIVV